MGPCFEVCSSTNIALLGYSPSIPRDPTKGILAGSARVCSCLPSSFLKGVGLYWHRRSCGSLLVVYVCLFWLFACSGCLLGVAVKFFSTSSAVDHIAPMHHHIVR